MKVSTSVFIQRIGKLKSADRGFIFRVFLRRALNRWKSLKQRVVSYCDVKREPGGLSALSVFWAFPTLTHGDGLVNVAKAAGEAVPTVLWFWTAEGSSVIWLLLYHYHDMELLTLCENVEEKAIFDAFRRLVGKRTNKHSTWLWNRKNRWIYNWNIAVRKREKKILGKKTKKQKTT